MPSRRELLVALARGELPVILAVPGGTRGTPGTLEQRSARKPLMFQAFRLFQRAEGASDMVPEQVTSDIGIEAALPARDAELVSPTSSHPRDFWLPADWRVRFDECAGRAEYQDGLPRAEAEARAFECCVAEWQIRNFGPSEPGRCAACGSDDTVDPLIPLGGETLGHVWLHSRCWTRYRDRRRARAVAALRAMGVG